jgi:glycosyltransferase involved in cell wall biosynthesis
MACSWRDIVDDRLRFMASQGRGRLTEDDLRRFHIPRVGVVMPVFNAERYLEEALNSMGDQTYRDFEVLAVNDGSTDESRRILERHAGPNLRIFDLPRNCGVTKALNLGLLVSRSEYLARMDADDVSMPDRLSKQVDFMDENRDIGIVGSMFWSMDELLSSVTWANQDIPLSPADISMELMNRCCIGHPTIMMRRRVVETIGGYDESPDCKAVEDYELWLRASKRFKIANMPLHLLKHRTYSGQVSSVLAETQRANFLKVRDRYRSMGATN